MSNKIVFSCKDDSKDDSSGSRNHNKGNNNNNNNNDDDDDEEEKANRRYSGHDCSLHRFIQHAVFLANKQNTIG